ncbi:MAG: exo-alpha-sialidase [Chloroflexi bacterium]|nr:exo-alpha-sialidase [Chloroflexota bacterium]
MTEAGLLVSTRKGLLVGRSSAGRVDWEWTGLEFSGWVIDYTVRDPRSGAIWCAAHHEQWGARLHRSDDDGATWSEAGMPAFADGERSLESIWTIEPGAQDGVLFAGVMPAAVFRSDDDGDSWQEIESLSSHPFSEYWMPGAAGLMFHHLNVDQNDPDRLVIGGSATGIFASYDGGESWESRNAGIRSDHMPPELQHMAPCVHSMFAHPKQRGRIWQQNHFGQYRSDDDGETWIDVGQGLPGEFGFASAIDPGDPDVCYYIPLDSDQSRMPRDGALAVFRTADAGETWERLSSGLPQSGFHQGIFRQALGQDGGDPLGLYMGSSGGQLYASNNGGESWTLIRSNLAPVTAVRAWQLDGQLDE